MSSAATSTPVTPPPTSTNERSRRRSAPERAPLRGGAGLLGHLEELDDARAQRHGVDQRLERPTVRLGARHPEPVRDAARADHQRVPRLPPPVVQLDDLPREVDPDRLVLVEADVAMPGHLAERVND